MNKMFMFLFCLFLIIPISYAVIEIKQAELTARDYTLEDTAYFNNKHTTYFFLLNIGNEPTKLTQSYLRDYAIPYACFPRDTPPIKPAYVLQYYCTSDTIFCTDETNFSFTPLFEYVKYSDFGEDKLRTLVLPEKKVFIKSPLRLTDPIGLKHLELTLDRGYRLHLLLENKGLTPLTASFELIVPGYTLLEIHTINGTLLPEELEEYQIPIEPLEEIPLTFYLIPKFPGVGEPLAVRVYDPSDRCVDDVFVWDVTVWAVFGRVVRILSSFEFGAVILLLIGMLLVLNKDKLFKK